MPLHPAFIQQMTTLLGADEAERLCTAIGQTAPAVSVRRNAAKVSKEEFLQHFSNNVDGAVPWAEEGVYLKERPAFIADPWLHAGRYYVQEASSMFLEQAVRALPEVPQRVLDLCAAPGGKSTLWRSLLPEGALLVANEPIGKRAQILAENMAKWGQPDTVVTNAYPADFAQLGGFFDAIGADVPCSGEGMFRKDEGAIEEWTQESPAACAERQWGIICDVWPALKQGGHLIYSTCTFNREENEDMVARICQELGAELVALPIAAEQLAAWGVAGDTTGRQLPVYHFFPHRVKGEGLFLALLRKTSEAPAPSAAKAKKAAKAAAKGKGGAGKGSAKGKVEKGSAQGAEWLAENAAFRLFRPSELHLSAVREALFDDVQQVSAAVRTLAAGILLSEDKGKKPVPQQPLALSTALAADAFPRVDVDRDTALAYLQREAVVLPAESPRGFVLLCFDGAPLGFVNNLGNRANNLYPAEWRIRHLATK